jgi:hypothetical protein
MLAGQAAGTRCGLSASCVGTTTQRVSCDLGVVAPRLGYCAKNDLVYRDHFSALVDERSMLKRALADDGFTRRMLGIKSWRAWRLLAGRAGAEPDSAFH